jgi:quercetin dioxygenase-like cupin family protein
MEFVKGDEVRVLSNSGVESHQLLFPENSLSARVTITKVVVSPDAVNPPHRHETSEQVWVAIAGTGTLLLEGGTTKQFQAGDVVRFADGDVHGFRNTGLVNFVYLSVTSPPINFRQAYEQPWDRGGASAA